MERVTIIGLGLIGGSIGLGLRQWSNNSGKRDDVLHLTGFDTDLNNQNYAKKIKAVEKTEWNLQSSVEDADLIVIAVPALAVKEVMMSIAPVLKPGAVVTDVTSTKVQVMEWAQELLPDTVHFVGGHPMAGGTLGIQGAKADLFQGCTWCIVPSLDADDAAVQTTIGLAAALGAETLFVDAHEHDGYVGGISHLPFMLSTALVNSVSKDAGWRDMKKLTSTGFRDASRMAGGSAEMHRDICITNRESIVRWVNESIDQLLTMRSLIEENTPDADEALLKVFSEARDAHAEWSTAESSEGRLIQDTADEHVDVSFGSQFSQMMFGNLFRRRPRVDGNGTRDEPSKKSG